MIDKGICYKGYNWSSINYERGCDKSCDVEEYLDYKNCKCRKRFVDILIEECSENINKKELHPHKMITKIHIIQL